MRADLGSLFHLLAECHNHKACSNVMNFTLVPCGTLIWHDFAEAFAFLFILLHSLVYRMLTQASYSAVSGAALNPLGRKIVLTRFHFPRGLL